MSIGNTLSFWLLSTESSNVTYNIAIIKTRQFFYLKLIAVLW